MLVAPGLFKLAVDTAVIGAHLPVIGYANYLLV